MVDLPRRLTRSAQEGEVILAADREQHSRLDLDGTGAATDIAGVPDVGAAKSCRRETAAAKMLCQLGQKTMALSPSANIFPNVVKGSGCSLPPPFAFAMTKLLCLARPPVPEGILKASMWRDESTFACSAGVQTAITALQARL